jgi:ribonuclease HI
MVAAHRVHRDATSAIPAGEGAAYVGADMGINKAEYFAAIHGLRLVADRMYVGDWSRDPVHIVTDNAFVFNQGVGNWAAGELGWHFSRLSEVLDLLVDMTGEQVWFHHATNQQNAGAHTLAANFPKICDLRNREEWQRQHLEMRWGPFDSTYSLRAMPPAPRVFRERGYEGTTRRLSFSDSHPAITRIGSVFLTVAMNCGTP